MDDAPWPAPAGHGQWMYNPGWGEEEDPHWREPYGLAQWFYNEGKGENVMIQGWLLVQGKWQDGVVLTWHVQRNMHTAPGSLFWVCVK